jgi:hypothetical protein
MMAFNPVYGYLVDKHSCMISMLLFEYLDPTATHFNDGCQWKVRIMTHNTRA